MTKGFPKINIEDYNYNLPEERIAQYPVKERDSSKLLVYRGGKISKDKFRNIHRYLPEDTLLVFNNTRVIRARLLFKKETGATIEILCLEPLVPFEYEQSFSSLSPVEWKCIVGNLKKWKNGTLTSVFDFKGKQFKLYAEKIKPEGEAWRIRFRWSAKDISFGEVTDVAGHIPLPPYVKREDENKDNVWYQTVYSRIKGSVAAPTAGLHFTEKVLNNIRNKGIKSAELTLHIGAGTFQPVKANDISQHAMHCEHFIISKSVLKTLIFFQGKIIAVGTTSVRTLESLYWLGVKVIRNPSFDESELLIEQWEPYTRVSEVSLEESFKALLEFMKKRKTASLNGATKIMIIPGYKFRVIDGMITNFHQPKSTLLLLISAWVGNDWKVIYNFAFDNNFRFLSYGDCSLLLK
jgi:S-adenosylmethionine:tRNA ribosyltransferase-isomerase